MRSAWLLGLLVLGLAGCEEVTGPAGYVATFDDAGGLRPGGPVYVAGVKVGRIKGVDLAEGKAQVELLVEGQHEIELTDKACVSIGRYAFDPETHVKLVPAKDGRPLDRGGKITCVRSAAPLDEEMQRATSAAVDLLEAALDDKGTIGRLLKDEKLADRVVAFFEAGPPRRAETHAEELDDDDAEEGKDAEKATGQGTGEGEPKRAAEPPPAKATTPTARPGLKDPQF